MEKQDIIIKHLNGGCFDVIVGDKSTEQLTYDEMLGVITQLTVPDEKRCLRWLKTKEDHEAASAHLTCSHEVDFENIH